MRNITRSIGKKESVCIYKMPNDDKMYIRIIGQSARVDDQDNVAEIKSLEVKEITEYGFPDYERSERNPNCTVPSSDFSKMCSAMGSLKCREISVVGYNRSIIFKAETEGGISNKRYRYGKIEDSSQHIVGKRTSVERGQNNRIKIKVRSSDKIEKVGKIIIPMSIMKSLGKLNNLSTAGTIKFFMESESPLKIICNIGNYGI